MKTFEERYTTWLEGSLNGTEREQFERELPDRAAAEADKSDFSKMKLLLRRHAAAPPLCNPDFFNFQLTEKIEAEHRRETQSPPRRSFFWSLPNLAWAGACCLLIFVALFKTIIPGPGDRSVAPTAETLAETARKSAPLNIQTLPASYTGKILDVHSSEPGVSATAVQSENEKVPVIWVDGLDYLPANYKLQ
jgi:anti-sigma factor RsiW